MEAERPLAQLMARAHSSLILAPSVLHRQGISQVITQPAWFSAAADWLSQYARPVDEVILSCCQVKALYLHNISTKGK